MISDLAVYAKVSKWLSLGLEVALIQLVATTGGVGGKLHGRRMMWGNGREEDGHDHHVHLSA